MRFLNEWDKLLAVAAFTPIGKIGFSYRAVDDVLFQLGDEAFVLAPSYDSELRRSDVPRVTMAMWAGDIGIARRVVLRQIQADAGATPALPPAELCAVRPTYVSVWNWLGSTGDRRPQVIAAYRIATDGRHTHTSIRSIGYEFVFRSVNPKADEPVIAVLVRLKGLGGERVIRAPKGGGR